MLALFVFGTLKRGFPLHKKLGDAKFLGCYRTVERFPMVVAGQWFAPMMLDHPGEGLHVEGELYEVDAALLTDLDKVESVGQPGNFRRSLFVEPCTGGSPCRAFAYIKSAEIAAPVHSQHLDSYQDRRFVAPHQRS